ncbi:MAG: ribbon-helix-helix domain-containing protein [Bdellovibrionales bacterium]|nr:ribbon-helix-helix domain-containing protein [Bdellovibrionales bacterium]
MKVTYNMPKRKYCSGDKKMISLRLPEQLIKKLEQIAEKHGFTVTDMVATSLDNFIQSYEDDLKKK